jgi:hypothetical protein
MENPEDKTLDFAISYAGEQSDIATEIDRRLTELGFFVFFAERSRLNLAGQDGESLFLSIFSEAKQVIVLISEEYKQKEWTRYEWDVIRKRENINRFIPVRIDDTMILGLPSNVLYLEFTGGNYANIVDAAVSRLLSYEQSQGLSRPTEYESILHALQHDSKGALSQAYQLVKDKRRRTPLENYPVPSDRLPAYRIVEREWFNFSVVRRLSVKIVVPSGADRNSIRFDLMHCAASHFNAAKPDAIMVFAYLDEGPNTDTDAFFTAGRAIFAPFGKWEKAQDGVAYNLPISDFEFALDFA